MDKILKLLVSECKKFNSIEKISLFGSRARGDFTDKSDYDIAIYGTIPLNDKVNISDICNEQLPTLHKIDVVFINEQKDKSFTDRIESEEIIIYDKI